MPEGGEHRAATLQAPGDERVLAVVPRVVRHGAQKLEVFGAVVLPVSVPVVDYLGPEERAAHNLLHDQAVQGPESAVHAHVDVAAGFERARAARPLWVAAVG